MMVLSASYLSTPTQTLIEDRLMQLRQKIVLGQGGAGAASASDAKLSETEGILLALPEAEDGQGSASEPKYYEIRQASPQLLAGLSQADLAAASLVAIEPGRNGGALNLEPGDDAVIRIDSDLARGMSEVSIGWAGINSVRLTFAAGNSLLIHGLGGASLSLHFSGSGQQHRVNHSVNMPAFDHRV